jgi:hypothetical protein
MNEIWSFEHSLACDAPRDFAWRYWTDVRNWKLDADVDSVYIDGDFAEGARGATITRRGDRIEWHIASVEPGTAAVIEIPLPGAAVRFHWTFSDRDGGARITQHVHFYGTPDSEFLGAATGLEAGIPAGMQKLCEYIEGAFRASRPEAPRD